MRLRLCSVFLAGLVVLSACQPTIANRGNILDPEKLDQVKVGVTTREEVATRLGTPTEIGTFDDKTWYYVGRQTKQYSFLDPEVIKQQAVEIHFDDQGIVTAVNNLDVSKAKDIDTVDRTTPTFGNDHTFIQQLLGNLAHPVPGDAKKQEGQ